MYIDVDVGVSDVHEIRDIASNLNSQWVDRGLIIKIHKLPLMSLTTCSIKKVEN